ncbi:MAG: FecR domain-containing protein [Gammaproteobacteria bacterium]
MTAVTDAYALASHNAHKENSIMRQLLFTLALALPCLSAVAAEAGRVVFVAGQAQVGRHAAALETAVQEGDELSTGADGYIYMKTVDNGFLILRPNSRARVTAYHVDAANPANTRVKLELLNGVARSISGTAVKQARQNFRFNTPVAAIGVRGTDFIVYTNDKSSWVSVVSGGVVMSGFAGACGPEGSGPCEGQASRELFAGRPDTMLQIERGQDVPRLLNSPTISPEVNAPARPDEPVGKVAARTSGSAALTDISLDPAKNPLPESVVREPVPTPTVPPPVVTPLPTPVLPVVVERSAPEVIWGRWKAVAWMQTDAEILDKMNSAAYVKPIIVGSFALSRPLVNSLVMPREGTVGFALTNSEAYMQKDGGLEIKAELTNAILNIDFAARTFATSFDVSSPLGTLSVNTNGSVTQQGALAGALFTGTTVKGYLGGAGATEAVYGFKTNDSTSLSAQGVTRWSR